MTGLLEEAWRRLEAIERRAEQATPGPWGMWAMEVLAKPTPDASWDRDQALHIADTADPHRGLRTFNGDFIASARTDVPDLAAAVRVALELHEPLLYDEWSRQTRDPAAAVSGYCTTCRRPTGVDGCETVQRITAELTKRADQGSRPPAAEDAIPTVPPEVRCTCDRGASVEITEHAPDCDIARWLAR